MPELENQLTSIGNAVASSTAGVISTMIESINLNGAVEVEKDEMKQTVLTMSCSLTQDNAASIQACVTNMGLFLANSQLVQSEILKFRKKTTQVGKGLNCFVF